MQVLPEAAVTLNTLVFRRRGRRGHVLVGVCLVFGLELTSLAAGLICLRVVLVYVLE